LNYTFDWNKVLSGEYLDWIISGVGVTLQISVVSLIIALLLGTTIAVMRMTKVKPLIWFSAAFTEFFRNTPLLVQIFFWYFGADSFLPRFVLDWLYQQDFEFCAGVIALSVYSAAFIAEEIRAGVNSIPKNQLEASRAYGLTFVQAMRYVILPQAFRIIVPPMISQALNLVKNSSLCMTIGVAELTYMARQIESYTFRGFEAFTISTLIYLCISLIVSFSINLYNKRYLRAVSY